MRRIVLGSTSPYRAQLLRRLLQDFQRDAPDLDETALHGELPHERALRLAMAKARAVGARWSDALVIGSDQVAEVDGVMLDKPGSVAVAKRQLAACSNRLVRFHTALCVFDSSNNEVRTHVDETRVAFRVLSDEEIARYIEREQPLDCAGSFKCEGLGVSLFEQMQTHDPTALIGLPLIALARILREAGVAVP